MRSRPHRRELERLLRQKGIILAQHLARLVVLDLPRKPADRHARAGDHRLATPDLRVAFYELFSHRQVAPGALRGLCHLRASPNHERAVELERRARCRPTTRPLRHPPLDRHRQHDPHLREEAQRADILWREQPSAAPSPRADDLLLDRLVDDGQRRACQLGDLTSA